VRLFPVGPGCIKIAEVEVSQSQNLTISTVTKLSPKLLQMMKNSVQIEKLPQPTLQS